MLKLDNVSFGPLYDISLELNAGECCFLLGPNGAGKSTLLKLASGELNAEKGTVELAGHNYQNIGLADRARCRSYLAQHQQLDFPFSVLEVILLGRFTWDSGREVDHQLALEALEALDIQHLEKKNYCQLSGGEQQRVQLARVLVQIWQHRGQRLLLLDEPTAALDLAHQHQLLKWLQEFKKQGVAIMLVVHDLNLAARYADRVFLIKNGRLAAEGAVSEVMQADTLSQVFDCDLEVQSHQGKPLILPA